LKKLTIRAESRVSIEYLCTACQKQRIIFIPKTILPFLNEGKDIFELVDVHECGDSSLRATKLFIDTNNSVRSHVLLRTDIDKTPSIIGEQDVEFGIPIPSISKYKQQILTPTIDYGGVNLYSLKIIDKLREEIYYLEENSNNTDNPCNEIVEYSTLNFIETKICINPSLNAKIAQLWIKKINDLIEHLVYLDNFSLAFIPAYIDRIIENPPDDIALLELDLLFQSRIAIPHSYKTNIDIFEKNFDEIFPMTPAKVYKIFIKMLKECCRNIKLTIYDIYEIFKNEELIFSFPYFLSLFSKLVSFGFINIEKLEFLTK